MQTGAIIGSPIETIPFYSLIFLCTSSIHIYPSQIDFRFSEPDFTQTHALKF